MFGLKYLLAARPTTCDNWSSDVTFMEFCQSMLVITMLPWDSCYPSEWNKLHFEQLYKTKQTRCVNTTEAFITIEVTIVNHKKLKRSDYSHNIVAA